ncbi:ABC transporter substrate-binding protein [Pseudoroseicyclus aestuarii]|nr:ABC transporter substrate-binding protein [Pseudoroseicyclus aestuarii]
MKHIFSASLMAIAAATATSGQAQDSTQSLTVALDTIPDTLCITCPVTFPRRILYNVFDPLIGRDYGADGQGTDPVPGLATAWEQVSPTELDLTIRQDVVFHDGTPMTAEDVAFTLSEEKLWGAEALTPDALARGVFTSVEVLDPETVRITTAFPDPSLVRRLQSHIGRVVPKAYFEEVGAEGFDRAPIGTGPYQFETFDPRSQVVLTANQDYWGPVPQVEEVIFRDIPETAARVAGLISGELDLIVGVLPQQFDMLETRGFRAVAAPQENIQMLSFMTGPEDLPLHDPLLRRALVAAADLEGISTALFGGTVTPINGIQLPLYGDYYTEQNSTHDHELAQDLVAQSGYDGAPISLQLITGGFVLVNETVQLLQEQWAAAGLNVELDIIPDYTQHTLVPPTQTSMWSTSNNVTMADPYEPVCATFTGGSYYAAQGRIAPSEALDALCAELRVETDVEARQELWTDIQAAWAEAPQALFLWQRPEFYAMRSDLDWAPTSDFAMLFAPVDPAPSN